MITLLELFDVTDYQIRADMIQISGRYGYGLALFAIFDNMIASIMKPFSKRSHRGETLSPKQGRGIIFNHSYTDANLRRASNTKKLEMDNSWNQFSTEPMHQHSLDNSDVLVKLTASCVVRNKTGRKRVE